MAWYRSRLRRCSCARQELFLVWSRFVPRSRPTDPANNSEIRPVVLVHAIPLIDPRCAHTHAGNVSHICAAIRQRIRATRLSTDEIVIAWDAGFILKNMCVLFDDSVVPVSLVNLINKGRLVVVPEQVAP